RANFNYKFNSSTRMSINYNGSTTQPSIQQIQPIQDNTNPLIITIGNPLLKQAFVHNIRLFANSYKVFSQRGFFLFGNFSTTQNAIVTSSVVDYSSGKTVNQYINSNGSYNYSSSFDYNMKLKKLDMNVSAGLNVYGGNYSNFINNIKNTTTNNDFGINAGINKQKEKKYDFNYRINVDYNTSKSSINSSIQTNYWTYNHNLSLNLTLPKRFEFNTDVDASFRQKTDLFTKNNDVIQWNAYIGKKLFKNDKGLIKFSAYDILDQNKGYDRYITSSVIQETNYQTINRYFLLSFVWNISKNAATANNAATTTISK
ncbi:MAG: outer membrane beta-barrel protein, partial [Bacteroidota bacterium]